MSRKFWQFLILVMVSSLSNSQRTVKEAMNKGYERQKKLFPIFQLVRFQNTACTIGTDTGTCYTATECEERNGASLGTCAEGWGVCCQVSGSCGTSTRENCTIFTNPTPAVTGECRFEVCPCGDNICQLRLDFNMFTIAGPNAMTNSIGKATNNELVNSGGQRPVSDQGQCQTDTFRVSNPRGRSPPVICGVNTMEHMYVDMDSGSCNDLVFLLGMAGVNGVTVPNRQWTIKATQYSCDYNNLAPPGCTQYFFDTTGTGTVQTYNFNNRQGQHLANQNQQVCVRRERGFCRICWAAVVNNMMADFALSGNIDRSTGLATVMSRGLEDPLKCCRYSEVSNPPSLFFSGYDCVIIAGAMSAGGMAKNSRICGRGVGLVTTTLGNMAATVCTTNAPFRVSFITDQFENVMSVAGQTPMSGGESAVPNIGARLAYTQDAMNC